jgi:hypothetical protein
MISLQPGRLYPSGGKIEAEEIGITVSVVVMDAEGNLQLFRGWTERGWVGRCRYQESQDLRPF